MSAVLKTIGFLLSLFLVTTVQSEQLNITINQVTYIYEKPTKLNVLLAPIAQSEAWHWPASKLYALNSDEANDLKQSVLGTLDKLKNEKEPGTPEHTVFLRLLLEIERWNVGKRIDTDINYDRARMLPKFNPTFDYGDYKLMLFKRPSMVEVFGVVPQTTYQKHISGMSLNDYIESHVSLANKDFLYIIKPNGKTVKVGRAYYNETPFALMPGSIIFVPFEESLLFDDRMKNLNEALLKLIKFRMVG